LCHCIVSKQNAHKASSWIVLVTYSYMYMYMHSKYIVCN
jgi:hypothetical protein